MEPTQHAREWPEKLLEGFRAGRRAALSEVYRRHAPEIALTLRRGFVFSSRGRTHRFAGFDSAFDLQDALHETFRVAFEPRTRASYDGSRPYAPYLRTIARNVVLQQFRRRDASFVELDDAAPITEIWIASGEPPSPERRVHEGQVRGLVAQFMAELDEDDRQLVELRFVRGLSQRDAAEELGQGRQRVRTRELRLRETLLAYLAERGELGLVEGLAGASAGLVGAGLIEILTVLAGAKEVI